MSKKFPFMAKRFLGFLYWKGNREFKGYKRAEENILWFNA